MEQQAKARLTGGVILVVLLVLLVPELLTGPRSSPQPAPAQPDQAPMRSYTMDLGEAAHAGSAPVAASTAAPAASEPVVPVASAPEPAPAPPIIPTPPDAAAEARAPAPSPSQAPASAAATEHATDHRAPAWTVQLGTFSNRENAARLVTKLRAHGFSPSISEATKGGHRWYRVRVGNEPDRAAAQKLLGHLRAAGEKGGEIVSR